MTTRRARAWSWRFCLRRALPAAASKDRSSLPEDARPIERIDPQRAASEPEQSDDERQDER